MKIIISFSFLILYSCGMRIDQYTQMCIGEKNPQTEYYTGIQAVSQFMPPLALFLAPLALLESEKDRNVKQNYDKLIKSKNNQNLINSLENNLTNEITIWENEKFCTIRSIKPIKTFKIRNRDCRELEWFYFKYTPYGRGNASTGVSTYCRESNIKNWSQISENTQCSSDFNKIYGDSCISDKTYNFPFSLINPYANAYSNALGYYEFIPMNTLEKKIDTKH